MKWALLWALLIFILCSIPGKDVPHISFLELLEFDKFVHAFLFFILSVLLIRGFKIQSSFSILSQKAKVIAVSISIVYGGSLEIMQGAVFEGRSADIYDFIANTTGCIIAIFLYEKIETKYPIKLIT